MSVPRELIAEISKYTKNPKDIYSFFLLSEYIYELANSENAWILRVEHLLPKSKNFFNKVPISGAYYYKDIITGPKYCLVKVYKESVQFRGREITRHMTYITNINNVKRNYLGFSKAIVTNPRLKDGHLIMADIAWSIGIPIDNIPSAVIDDIPSYMPSYTDISRVDMINGIKDFISIKPINDNQHFSQKFFSKQDYINEALVKKRVCGDINDWPLTKLVYFHTVFWYYKISKCKYGEYKNFLLLLFDKITNRLKELDRYWEEHK